MCTVLLQFYFCEIMIVVLTTVTFVVQCDASNGNSNSNRNLSPRIVNTKYGSLKGTVVKFETHSSSETIEAYLGVAYATPPIGSLRFMPPVTPTHWRGIREANQLSRVCPQRIPLKQLIMNNATEALKHMPLKRYEYMRHLIPLLKNQSEDCLYLNIYTPVIVHQSQQSGPPDIASSSPPINKRVPVLIFIHGESYDWNSGNVYDGTILSSFGQVIVVTLNYRLGILGFLPAKVDGVVRGNYGLMDQVAALHWIQENIGEFGGQTDNITIIGHGYGAACAHLLMISPMARGLFSRVILMSGSALTPWAIARDSDLYAKNLAQALNCPNHDSSAIVDCLRKKKVDDILRIELRIPSHLTAFGPIIDSIVVPSDPKKLLLQTWSTKLNKVAPNVGSQYDLLFGANRLEGPCIFAAHEEKVGIDASRRDRILRTLVRNLFDFHQQAIFLTLINEYTDWSRSVEQPINILESMADILSDSLVVSPLIQTGDLHSAQHHPESTAATSQSPINAKTYFYVFLHQNEENSKYHPRQSCSHSEELEYMFGAPLSSDSQFMDKSIAHFTTNYTKAELSLSETLMTYWINFAKFGDPNTWPHDSDSSNSDRSLSSGSNSKLRYDSVVWPHYNPIQRKYLLLGLKPKVRDHYNSHRLSFWLNLIPRLHHPGEEQVYLRHHLLTDHENLAIYDGIVRQIAFKFLSPLPTVSQNTVISATTELTGLATTVIATQHLLDTITTSATSINVDINNNPSKNVNNATPTTSSTSVTTTSTTTSVIVRDSNYSTALTITIAIGCSLLILNILIFAGVYYQLDKNRTIAQQNNQTVAQQQNQSQQSHHTQQSVISADKIEEQPNTSRISIPSPISNMMQSDHCIDHIDNIYYQYKNTNKYISNNISNTNSMKRAQKVAIPTVPNTKIGSHHHFDHHLDHHQHHDQASQVPLLLTNDIKHIPVYLEHNSIAKEMAV